MVLVLPFKISDWSQSRKESSRIEILGYIIVSAFSQPSCVTLRISLTHLLYPFPMYEMGITALLYLHCGSKDKDINHFPRRSDNMVSSEIPYRDWPWEIHQIQPMVCSNTNKWRKWKWKRLTALQGGIGASVPLLLAHRSSMTLAILSSLGNQRLTTGVGFPSLSLPLRKLDRRLLEEKFLCAVGSCSLDCLSCVCHRLQQPLVFFLHPNWRRSRVQNWEMQLAFATCDPMVI